MKREDLLKDEWVKENFGDACYPNYLEPNFEAGVEYGERKAIERACEWFRCHWRNYINVDADGVIGFAHWKSDFKKAIEE